MDENKINIIYDEDLHDLLSKLWVLEDILKGKKKCKFTGEIITIDNLYTIFWENNEIKFVCDNINAQKQFLEYINNKNG